MQEQVAYSNKVAEETVTSNLVNKIQCANTRQSELIYNIEDKLHSILNLRTPEKDLQKLSEPKSLSDFTQAMDDGINLIQMSNDRLENVLSHLRKIV